MSLINWLSSLIKIISFSTGQTRRFTAEHVNKCWNLSRNSSCCSDATLAYLEKENPSSRNHQNQTHTSIFHEFTEKDSPCLDKLFLCGGHGAACSCAHTVKPLQTCLITCLSADSAGVSDRKSSSSRQLVSDSSLVVHCEGRAERQLVLTGLKTRLLSTLWGRLCNCGCE